MKGSHTYPLLPKRSEGKGVKKGSDRRGEEDENVLGTHVELDMDERNIVAVPLKAGTPFAHLDAMSIHYLMSNAKTSVAE